jgi:hypothetical protein
LKILTPVGTATANDEAANAAFSQTGSPTVNMWCAHTSIETNAIPIVANATAL